MDNRATATAFRQGPGVRAGWQASGLHASGWQDSSLASIPAGGHGRRVVFLAMALTVNWFLAAQMPSQVFSWTSLLIFVWLLFAVLRFTPAGFVLLLPLALTRASTLVSLVAIEAGAYMPEVGQRGAMGDASASFVVFTAILFASFAVVFRAIERPALAYVRSPLLDRLVGLLGWPVLLGIGAWGAIAAAYGMAGGFPLLEGMDRFLFRREYSSPLVLWLLDNKLVIAALLGAIAFSPHRGNLLRGCAMLGFVALTGLYFLFGDKFFTILTEAMFFVMPLLLRHRARLGRTLLIAAAPAAMLLCLGFAVTIHIYSDYGRLPLDRTLTRVGERIAGQGELWFVATRDDARVTNWDGHLVDRYLKVLGSDEPAEAAFSERIETYYFIDRYAPDEIARGFRRTAGWVQLTMGTEAMALVMFGYVGVAVIVVLGGALLGVAAAYLLRVLTSGFALSIALAVWTYLQVSFALQQASLWPVAADGQVKRVLLFATIELVLLALNRGAVGAAVRPGGLARPRRPEETLA